MFNYFGYSQVFFFRNAIYFNSFSGDGVSSGGVNHKVRLISRYFEPKKTVIPRISNVQMFICSNVPIFQCFNVQCSNIQMLKCSNVQMSNFKCQISNVKYQISIVNKVKLLSERTSEFLPSFFTFALNDLQLRRWWLL